MSGGLQARRLEVKDRARREVMSMQHRGRQTVKITGKDSQHIAAYWRFALKRLLHQSRLTS